MGAEFKASDRFSPVENVCSRQVEKEVVVVDVKTGNYYVLDDVSTFLWRQLEAKPSTVAELLALLLEEYETTQEECSENVENFCRYMLAEKLVATS